MSVEKPNEKSVRLTGMDDGAVKVFLVTSSPKDADALHCALKSRLAELKSTQEEFTSLTKEENKDISEKNGDTCKIINTPDIEEDGVSSTKKLKTTDV